MTERTESGKLTEEFLQRMEQNQGELPEILVALARIQRKHIEETAEPSEENIKSLLGHLKEQLGGAEAGRAKLTETCGNEGALCGLCPFGAFIPQEMGFASPVQPICLPWISVTQPD